MKPLFATLVALAFCSLASAATIELSWQDNSDDEDGFIVERRMNGGEWSVIATLDADVEIYQDKGLLRDTEYTYRVAAFHMFGYSDYSNEASATTRGGPKAPSKAEAKQAPYLRVIDAPDGTRTTELYD